jgi:alanine racemase
VYYQGRLLNALGRVAMQSMMVDISNEPEIKVGDVVEAPMRRTSASARLPRVYVRDGKVVAIRVLIAENLSF